MSLNVITEKRERPFSCGSQAADWGSANCSRCTKEFDHVSGAYRCDIQKEIDAYMEDGSVSADIARRMGYSDPLAFQWACTEVDWTPEWRAEYAIRQTWRYRVQLTIWKIRQVFRKWYQGKRREIIESYRMPDALEHVEPETIGCWADWCTWALDMSDKPGPDDAGARCRRDAAESGSCWCGKFRCENPARVVNAGTAGKDAK